VTNSARAVWEKSQRIVLQQLKIQQFRQKKLSHLRRSENYFPKKRTPNLRRLSIYIAKRLLINNNWINPVSGRARMHYKRQLTRKIMLRLADKVTVAGLTRQKRECRTGSAPRDQNFQGERAQTRV